ncbi:pantoate--beta-alanine ligase [Thermogutta sp.]|jgi:pantoate--beta-alanine ligase|uniref:pantoate--beta-alanine ligase n=2 Tax=Thermogutta sp. TaxID=1962930 RepID=UPI0032204FC9
MAMPTVIRSAQEMQSQSRQLRRAGRRIGFVPTMGALHEGHLSLVRAAKRECEEVVVSIYVNPTQFGRGEDFERYPRNLEKDLELLADLDVPWVFAPTDSEMYPTGFDTWVEVGRMAQPWEGKFRPGHFRGVATVVLKLFHLVEPDIAYFGEKDYQQLLVVRQMVRDLNLAVEIRPCPTVREPDGLAMSSRNQYLSPKEREDALVLYRSLCLAQERVRAGEKDAHAIAVAMRELISSVPYAQIDYVALVDPETLEEVLTIDRPVQALLAVRLGSTRLIDNMRIVPPSE